LYQAAQNRHEFFRMEKFGRLKQLSEKARGHYKETLPRVKQKKRQTMRLSL
jgi:hypothetical protein